MHADVISQKPFVIRFECEEHGCEWDSILIDFDDLDGTLDHIEEHRKAHR